MAQAADSEGSSCVSFYHSPAKSITFSRDLLQSLTVSKEAVACPPEEPVDKKEEIQGEMGLNLGLSLGGYLDGKAKEKAPCWQKASSGNFQPRLRKFASGNMEIDGMELRDSKEDGQADCELALPPMVRNDTESGSSGLMTQGSQQHVLPEIKQEGLPMTQIRHQPTAQLQQEMLEQQRKREMHALRRQEARKKREEKQLKKARRERGMPIQASKLRNGRLAPLLPSYAPFPTKGSVFPFRIGMDSEKRLLESQMSSIRKKDRAAKKNELTFDRETKIKEKVVRDLSEQGDSQGIERQNSRTSPDYIEHTAPSPKGGDPSTSREFPCPSYPALPMAYSLPVLPNNSQCMSLPLGLPFPRPMPFWTATKGCDSPKANIPPFSNVLQPIATRALLPFQMPISGTSLGGFADPQTRPQRSSHAPGASPGRSSSAVSEYESRSSQGAISNDSKSQSTASSALHRFSSASNSQDQTLGCSEVSASSELEPRCAEEAPAKVPANTAQSALEIPSTATPHETEVADASSAIKPSQHQSASKATIRNSDDSKASEGKLRDMPLVLTTCEGPNGKTVCGWLYSYSKDEVRIVCTCHGTFLSPAEFVQHAGGTDLVHPERNIVVHPFPFRIPYTSETS